MICSSRRKRMCPLLQRKKKKTGHRQQKKKKRRSKRRIETDVETTKDTKVLPNAAVMNKERRKRKKTLELHVTTHGRGLIRTMQ